MKHIAALLWIALFAAPVESGVEGLALKDACTSSSASEELKCLYWFDGMLEQYFIWKALSEQSVPYCFPEDGISAEVAKLVWLKFTEENPEQLASRTGLSFSFAMRDAFPCD